ncbi:hypothetical protein KCP75_11840 [Salmonella enterica subsp. enterica]|nr:hypothetical protein KCP75_11840 [Salmonella enterica subsp. enterica]
MLRRSVVQCAVCAILLDEKERLRWQEQAPPARESCSADDKPLVIARSSGTQLPFRTAGGGLFAPAAGFRTFKNPGSVRRPV